MGWLIAAGGAAMVVMSIALSKPALIAFNDPREPYAGVIGVFVCTLGFLVGGLMCAAPLFLLIVG